MGSIKNLHQTHLSIELHEAVSRKKIMKVVKKIKELEEAVKKITAEALGKKRKYWKRNSLKIWTSESRTNSYRKTI